MTIYFSGPAPSGGFDKERALGHRLAFFGITSGEGETVHGDARWANSRVVIDIDNRSVHSDVRVYGQRLVPALVDSCGPVVSGRLVQGPQRKEGVNPPWLLQGLEPHEQAHAQDLLAPYMALLSSGEVSVNVTAMRKDGWT